MSGRVGSITTDIIADGLILNFDPANRASYIPVSTGSANLSVYNTISSVECTLENGVDFLQPPLSASCWSFDGIDSYIDSPDIWSDYVDDTDTICPTSICWWWKGPNPMDESVHTRYLSYFSAGGTGGKIIIYDGYLGAANNQLMFQIGSNANKWKVADNGDVNIFDGSWHYLVFVLPPGSTSGTDPESSKLYIDGYVVTKYGSSGVTPPATYYKWNRFIISNSSTSMLGEQATTQVYNRALSSTEVLHNYNALKSRFT